MKKLLFLLVLVFATTFAFSQINEFDSYESDTLELKSWKTTVDTINDVTTDIIRYQSLSGDIITIKKVNMNVQDKLTWQKSEIAKFRSLKKYAIRQKAIYLKEAKKWTRQIEKTNAKILMLKENFVKQDEIPEEELIE